MSPMITRSMANNDSPRGEGQSSGFESGSSITQLSSDTVRDEVTGQQGAVSGSSAHEDTSQANSELLELTRANNESIKGLTNMLERLVTSLSAGANVSQVPVNEFQDACSNVGQPNTPRGNDEPIRSPSLDSPRDDGHLNYRQGE